MTPRLAPIMVKAVPSLGWKIRKDATAAENLNDLLDKLHKLIRQVERRDLPAPEFLEKRAQLKQALLETGLTIAAARFYRQQAQNNRKLEQVSKAVAKEEPPKLLRKLLALLRNTPALQAKSHTYDEAWPEVEANYFLKVSLYQIELVRRGV